MGSFVSWFERSYKGIIVVLVAIMAVMMVILAMQQVQLSKPAAGTVPGPIPTFTSSAGPDNLEPLRAAMDGDKPITVWGMGSSVGAGASLTDPGKQAPSSHLVEALAPLTDAPLELHNASVNGSTTNQGLQLWRDKVRAQKPTVLLLTYGMNDGLPGAYNSGETFPGGISDFRTIVREARADGVTVLVATTPSPRSTADFALPEGLPVLYPEADAAATPTEPLTDVDGVPFSARHKEWNAAATKTAQEAGATVLDVVPSWTAAVASQGEDALFNSGEVVHPNLAGHKASYWAAIDQFVSDSLG